MIWYTSDLHFGHRLVADTRGFANTDEHDQAIVAHWDHTVGKDDIVYVLGDLSLGNPLRAIGIVKDMPGRKRLVTGNHDRCHPMNRNAHAWMPKYLEAFEYVVPFARRRIGGRSVLLSHFPYTDEREGPPRYMQYRLPDMGEYLVHGHLHERYRYTSKRELHVGWDAWSRFVSEDDVARWRSNEAV